jgi:hypothetical protein
VITASALAPNCAYAKILSAKKPRPPDQQAAIDRGVAFHDAIEDWIGTGTLPVVEDAEIQGWIDLLADKLWPPHLTNAEVEVAWGLWDDGTYTPVSEAAPHVYVATEEAGPRVLLTAGRADLAYEAGGVVTVFDWKTGKWPVTPAVDNLQLNAAGIALAQRAGVDWYIPCVVYVRDGHFDWGVHVGRGAGDWAGKAEAVRAAASLPPEPRPGDWCGNCWERKSCPRGPR